MSVLQVNKFLPQRRRGKLLFNADRGIMGARLRGRVSK